MKQTIKSPRSTGAAIFYPALKRRTKYTASARGTYYSYSICHDEIRGDCLHRCVYCDLHEDEVGGPMAMEIDHFRPKAQFSHLANDPTNLVLACRPCNRRKGSAWPARPLTACHSQGKGFVDPFKKKRSHYFEVGVDGTLLGKKEPASYVIDLLNLNRALCKSLRACRIEVSKTMPALVKCRAELKRISQKTGALDKKEQATVRTITELLEGIDQLVSPGTRKALGW